MAPAAAKNLCLSKPLTLEQIEQIYKQSVLKPEFYNLEYARDWIDNSLPSATMAEFIKTVLKPGKVLDIGCGIGLLVQELRKLGVEAYGLEYSNSFISISPAREFLYQGNITNLSQFSDRSFDLVVCMEVMEHLPPTYLNGVIKELRRISSNRILMTIPSFGPNDYGPAGLPLNESCWREDARRNVPFGNLVVDGQGIPDCGHISLASYRWWTQKFFINGLLRDHEAETIAYSDYHFKDYQWNLYVLKQMAKNVSDVTSCNFFTVGLYHCEDWAEPIGPVRWTGKEFSICLDIPVQYENVSLKFFSGPKEMVYERLLAVKIYRCTEDDRDLRLQEEMIKEKSYDICPDKWYSIPLLEKSELSGPVKFNFSINRTLVPELLGINNDKRELGIAINMIGVI